MTWPLSVGAASAPLSVLILAWGCDGGPSVVSGWRRFQLVGGRAVVVGTVGWTLPRCCCEGS